MSGLFGGAVSSWSVHSSSDQAIQVRAMAKDTVLCSCVGHLTLTVPLSSQEYNWVLANCWGNLTNCRGVTCDGLASHPGQSRNTPSRFMPQKPRISSSSYEPVGSKTSLLWVACWFLETTYRINSSSALSSLFSFFSCYKR